MCKQWLYHYKTSRFGGGSIEERCKRRQRKADGLDQWRFEFLTNMLPALLKFSLLFSSVSLSADLWIEHTALGSIFLGVTLVGLIFALCTFAAGIIFPDCPYTSPMIEKILKFLPNSKEKILAPPASLMWLQDHQTFLNQAFPGTFVSGEKYVETEIQDTITP